MMRRCLSCAAWFVLAAASCAEQPAAVAVRVQVPRELSERAQQFLRHGSQETPAVLRLEGIKLVGDQGLTLRIVGGDKAHPAVLASAAIVGAPTPSDPQGKARSVTLTVPLSDEVFGLAAGRDEILIKLEPEGEYAANPLRLGKVYFVEEGGERQPPLQDSGKRGEVRN